jgi:hypothetical protein
VANPSPQAVAKIRARVSDWSPDDAAIAESLNRPSLPNRPQVPVPLVEDTLADYLTDAANGSLVKLLNWPNYGRLADDIRSGDHAKVARWAPRLVVAGIITPGEAQALVGYINSTVPDPSWPAQISWAMAAIGRPVDASDVAAARPGA